MKAPSRTVRTLAVLWPAFCAAGLTEALVFAFVDPHDLRALGSAMDLSRSAVYTLAFLAFWVVTSAASAMTQWLLAEGGAADVTLDAPSAPWTSR